MFPEREGGRGNFANSGRLGAAEMGYFVIRALSILNRVHVEEQLGTG